jgi:hypothetical protein
MSPPELAAPPAWRSSTAASVEDDLKALWREAARRSPVTHAIMSNLVIVASGPPAAAGTPEPRETLVQVAERHPARIVLIEHHAVADTCGPLALRAGLLTFGPPDHRYGVEVISLAATCADRSLPSIIRGLVRGDVPTSVWFGGDLSIAPPALAMLAEANQFVYESHGWQDVGRGFRTVASLLADARPPVLVDLTWRQLADMRRAIVTALEPVPSSTLLQPAAITIEYGPGREASAWLLRGWLATRLRDSDGSPLRRITGHPDVTLRVLADTPAGTIGVTHRGQRIVIVDGAGRTLEVSPAPESLPEAIADSLLTLERNTLFEEIVTACATSSRPA